MTISQNILIALVNPNAAKEREETQKVLEFIQPFCGVATITSIAIAIFGLFLAASYPILGGIVVLTGLGATLASREIHILSKNVLSLLRSNVLSRGMSSYSAERLVETITKNTWIIKPFFYNSLVVLFNESH